MNIIKLFTDNHIHYWTEGKNVSTGWVNIQCPFCGDHSNHMGYSPDGVFVCWRCGAHPITKVLSKILRIDTQETYAIIRQYGGRTKTEKKEPVIKIGTRKFKYPSNTEQMTKRHHMYLESRNFDAEKLSREWGLLGTGPISSLDNIDFKHRIVAPIYWDNKIVSFQARDYTNKNNLRYITCPKPREAVHHKNILYGRQEHWHSTGICVEGITDVWRLGPCAFATFGIEYTLAQVRVIKKHFKNVVILFDCEDQAQEKARQLSAELNFRGIETIIMKSENDPASMTQEDADYLVKTVIHRKN